MIKKRKPNKKDSNTYKWVGYVLLAFALLLLLTCFIVEKDPKSVLSDVYHYSLGHKDKITKNESQWEEFLIEKDSEIDSLTTALNYLKSRSIPEFAKVKTSSTGLNLRNLPSTDSEVIAKIPDGEMVKLYYKDTEVVNVGGESGYWVKIQYQDIVGFVFSTYLEL